MLPVWLVEGREEGMRASLASRATGGRLRNCRPTVPGPFRPRLARRAPSTRPAPPCPRLVRLRSGLRLLSRWLTPCAGRSPDSLTGCVSRGEQSGGSEPAAGPGRAGALQPCPAHPDAPGTGTLCLLSPVTPTRICVPRCCLGLIPAPAAGPDAGVLYWEGSTGAWRRARGRPPPALFWMSAPGHRRPATAQGSSSTDVTLTKLARKRLFQKQPTDQPDKISWQLSFTQGRNIFQQFISISLLTPSSLEETVIPSVRHRGVCQISSICLVTHPWWPFRFHPPPPFSFFFLLEGSQRFVLQPRPCLLGFLITRGNKQTITQLGITVEEMDLLA